MGRAFYFRCIVVVLGLYLLGIIGLDFMIILSVALLGGRLVGIAVSDIVPPVFRTVRSVVATTALDQPVEAGLVPGFDELELTPAEKVIRKH